MRVFLAGAGDVLGTRIIPLLVEQGHAVTGMTRTPARADVARAEPLSGCSQAHRRVGSGAGPTMDP
jgi:nucleoside-diphosphate-sugar epimerase